VLGEEKPFLGQFKGTVEDVARKGILGRYRMRILIAEDDPTSRIMLASVLKKVGHDVVETSTGTEALEMLTASRAPRLAILDWMMPGLSGEEVCRKIRGIPTTDPPYLILLTGKEDEEGVVRGLDAGANDYLKKPYRGDELRARIGVGERMLMLQSDLNAAKEALQFEATHDALTGTLNRRAVLADFARELAVAKASSSSLSIGLCDIDFFKQINDIYGHQIGDYALCDFTKAAESELREGDFLGRYGGEEFLIIARGKHGSPELTMFERVRQKVQATCIRGVQLQRPFTVSIGVAHFPQAASVELLLALADRALYQAKREGRNRICFAPDPDR
jgi:diguanylate cyclase (GGDEF)-like protein